MRSLLQLIQERLELLQALTEALLAGLQLCFQGVRGDEQLVPRLCLVSWRPTAV